MASKMAVKDLHSSAPAQEEGLEELTESIKKSGIQMPLVVNLAGLVIDGVRRLQVARNLGLTRVPVVVSNDYETTMEAMKKNREHGECFLVKDHHRVNQAFLDTQGQMTTRHLAVRLLTKHERGGRMAPARDLLKDALGASGNLIQAATQFHRYAADPNFTYYEAAKDLLARMDAGMTGSMALQTFQAMRKREDPSNILDPAEQRSIVNNALVSLSAVCEALARVQHLSPEITTEELIKWRYALSPIKGQIQMTMNRIRNLIEEKNNAQGDANG